MSTTAAAVVMIVVIVIVGGAGYAGLSAAGGGSTSSHSISTCTPPTSPQCVSRVANDVTTFTPYRPGLGQQLVQVSQGQTIPATVGVTGPESVSNFQVNWGDGNTTSSKTVTQTHSYSGLGTYVISAQALVGTAWHTGYSSLMAVEVGPSLATSSSGEFPSLATSLSNGTSAAAPNFGWIQSGGGPVKVTASYSGLPANAAWVPGTPYFLAAPTNVTCTNTTTATSGSATCSFSSPGVYPITFVGTLTNSLTGAKATLPYTWTVVVSPTGVVPVCSSCKGLPVGKSPHPGEIDNYEVVAGGGITTDANVEYDSASAEPIVNVYQALLGYNGSDVGPEASNYIPVLSTCVPGGAGLSGCQAQYGSSLITNNASAGTPEYYTLPIDPNARFYDPYTGVGWPVYPTDIMFSVARYMAFGDNPSYPGWIIGQALLPHDANGSWDTYGGYPLHAFFYGTNANNTVPNIMSSMLVNDSTYCPAKALAANGCITFNAWAAGHTWPYMLELLASAWGTTVSSCGWYSYEGANLPGFPGTSAAKGDGPCLLPGNAKSTSDASFQSWLAAEPMTAWDALSILSLTGTPYAPDPNVATGAMVGTGPYYVTNWNPAVGYNLKASPVYHAPTGCAGQPGCLPEPGAYVPKVNAFWELDDTIPIQEYLAGQADFAGYSAPETGQILQLAKNGQIGFTTSPTLEIDQVQENLQFNVTTLSTFLPSPGVNIPADFFAQVGLRQFLAAAFPYNYYIGTIETVDGVAYREPTGGVIPRGMGNLYPTNITWPYGNPDMNPADKGGAAWWWANITNSKSPFYDALLASCSSAHPCIFPVLGEQGAAGLHLGLQTYSTDINTLTGGAFETYVYDTTFAQTVTYGSLGPGVNPLDFFRLGWAPDYPDASDYVGPYLYPDSIYTYSNALNEALSGKYVVGANPYNSTGCGHWNDYAYWSAYVTNSLSIPENCQYTAYWAMLAAVTAAASAVGDQRVLDFNMAEHVLSGLALMIYLDQVVGVNTYANWVNPGSLYTNIVNGLSLTYQYAYIQGNGML
jgi:hypothetical protein